MGIIALLFTAIALVAVLVTTKKGERATNPLILFLGLWTLILLLSIIRPFGMDEATNQAYLLLLIMVSGFLLGFIGVNLLRKKKPVASRTIVETLPPLKKSLALRILVGIAVVAIALNIIDWIIGLHYIFEGTPAWQVRNWSLQPFGSDNPILSRRSFIEDVLRVVVISPATALITPVAAYYFFGSKDKKTRLTLLIIAILNTITSSLAGGGGRLGYVMFAIYFAITYLCFKRFGKLRKQFNIKRLLIALSICGLAILLFTIFRTGFGKSLEQFSVYFGMTPTLLSKWLPLLGGAGFTFGLTTFFGVHSYGFRALKTLGLGAAIPAIYNISYNNILNAERFVSIGANLNNNAFVSPVYYFYADGGVIAVIIFSLLFGAICSLVYSYCREKQDLKHFLFYVLMLYGIIVSFMRIQTAIPSFIISIIFVLVLFNERIFKGKTNG